MRYLSLPEVLEIHRRVLVQSGGAGGVRDLGAVEASPVQDRLFVIRNPQPLTLTLELIAKAEIDPNLYPNPHHALRRLRGLDSRRPRRRLGRRLG